MSKSTTAVVTSLALLLLAQIASAEKVLRVIENSYESTTKSVDLPKLPSGRFSVRPCSDCPLASLGLENSSKFFLARQEVSYAEFRAFVSKNSRGLMIHFDPKTKVVTRLVVSG